MATATELYGTDIRHFRDLIPTASGDLSTQSGDDNLRNWMFRCLITVPGSVIHRPDFGVGIQQYQNKISSLGTQRRLAISIQEQFIKDPRIEKVLGVVINFDDLQPEQTTILIRVKPVGLDTLGFTFTPFGES